MDNKRWILSGDILWPDMDRDWIRMADRRWITTGYGLMTGDGSQETNDNQSPFLYEDIEVMRNFTLLEITTLISNYATTQLEWNADMQTYDVPAAWLHRVRYRVLFRALFRDTELCSYKPEFQCRIPSRIRSRVTSTMPIPHKPYEIHLWRSHDL